jgi:transcriptional regulator with XRE-family HTH domain
MQDELVGRVLGALRHRRGWRQTDLAVAADVARSVISDLEAGRVEAHAVGALRRSVHAAGGVLRLTVDLPGGDRDRLLDADHARVQAHWVAMLAGAQWEAIPEATFSIYGERGSIDILGWHAVSRTLVVAEVKTIVVEVGSLLAGLDRKARLARTLARERGWVPEAVVPALIVLDGTTARRRLTEHAALFGRLNLRGRAAVRWLRSPMPLTPTGLLILTKLPDARPGDRRRAGRQRIRVRRPIARSKSGLGPGSDDAESA